MQGPETEVENAGSPHRGLIPRILEHLFDRIANKHASANALRPGSLQFQVRCSDLEIYNETVTDLLDPSKANRPVRENTREGTIYVDGLTWESVSSVAQTNALLHRGVRNRCGCCARRGGALAARGTSLPLCSQCTAFS